MISQRPMDNDGGDKPQTGNKEKIKQAGRIIFNDMTDARHLQIASLAYMYDTSIYNHWGWGHSRMAA